MTDRQLKLLYDHYIKDNQIRIEGMSYVSHWVPENKEIEIWIENTEDVSYSTVVIDDLIASSIDIFDKIMGGSSIKYLDINYPYMGSGGKFGLYLNDEDSGRIWKSADNIKFLGSDEVSLSSRVVVGIEDIGLETNDAIRINTKVKLMNPKLDGRLASTDEVREYFAESYEFSDWLVDNEYEFYGPIVEEIVKISPQYVCDIQYMYFNFYTRIVDINNEQISG
jgi:hypothetical protein